MEGVSLVLLIKFNMKSQLGMVIDLLYFLSSTNQYFFTLCIMVQDFMKNIYHQNTGKIILMMTEVEFPQKNRLERSTIQNIKLIIRIDIML